MTGKHAVDAGDIFNREALRDMGNPLMGRRFKFAVFGGKVPQNRSNLPQPLGPTRPMRSPGEAMRLA